MHLWLGLPVSGDKFCYCEDKICSYTSETISCILQPSEQKCGQPDAKQNLHLHFRLFLNISFCTKVLLFCVFYKNSHLLLETLFSCGLMIPKALSFDKAVAQVSFCTFCGWLRLRPHWDPPVHQHDAAGHQVMWQGELFPYGHCGGTQVIGEGEEGAEQNLGLWCLLVLLC